MNITAAEVNKLRQATGAGMMDCKKALVEAEGDWDKAIDILRLKGQKVAAKRADHTANEGYVLAKTNADNTFGVVLMLNCETDFVAKNEEFVAMAKTIVDAALANKARTLDEVRAMRINGRAITDMITELVGKTGEKMEMPLYKAIEAAHVTAYNHFGNRLATLVGFNKNVAGVDAVGKEVAMQVAAMNPLALDEKHVDAETIAHELEIAKEQLRNEGKPENMIEKIAEGKLNKFFKENTLVHQELASDNKKTVDQFIKECDAELACVDFARLMLGA